jgi:hypothetical protein
MGIGEVDETQTRPDANDGRALREAQFGTLAMAPRRVGLRDCGTADDPWL